MAATIAMWFFYVCVVISAVGWLALILYVVSCELFRAIDNRRKRPEPNVAVIPAKGSWQYSEPFFNKVEEFRSDFK